MAMNGIGQLDLYNNYRINRAEEQEALRLADRNKEQPKENVSAEEPKEVSLSLNLDGIRERSNMSLSDVSLTMNPSGSSSFEMKALTFRPDQDEMEKAFSDVQKDQALMQYSTFVGDSNVITNDEDGIVLRKMSPEA